VSVIGEALYRLGDWWYTLCGALGVLQNVHHTGHGGGGVGGKQAVSMQVLAVAASHVGCRPNWLLVASTGQADGWPAGLLRPAACCSRCSPSRKYLQRVAVYEAKQGRHKPCGDSNHFSILGT
jgi:hypothetical protein